MSSHIKVRIRQSASDFKCLVWPIIAPYLGGGELEPVEGSTEKATADRMDIIAGIDAWQWLSYDRGVRGLASRVQWWRRDWDGSWPYNTFTVRFKTRFGNATEYAKRMIALRALEGSLLYPYLTVQAYVRKRGEGPVDSIGVVRTRDLFEFIQPGRTREQPVAGGNVMYVVRFSDLINAGIRVLTWPDCTQCDLLGEPDRI